MKEGPRKGGQNPHPSQVTQRPAPPAAILMPRHDGITINYTIPALCPFCGKASGDDGCGVDTFSVSSGRVEAMTWVCRSPSHLAAIAGKET